MAKRFSEEFKQQAIEYALANSYEPLATITVKLGISYSTSDKWTRTASPENSINRLLSPKQQQIRDLERKSRSLERQMIS